MSILSEKSTSSSRHENVVVNNSSYQSDDESCSDAALLAYREWSDIGNNRYGSLNRDAFLAGFNSCLKADPQSKDGKLSCEPKKKIISAA